MKTINPVCWFDIYVSNLERAKTFYETLLDVTLVDMPEEWGRQSAFPFENRGENATGALVEKEDFKPETTNTIVYFSSEDCNLELAKVAAAGGSIKTPKSSIGAFGFIALVQDTEGNTIGLHSKK